MVIASHTLKQSLIDISQCELRSMLMSKSLLVLIKCADLQVSAQACQTYFFKDEGKKSAFLTSFTHASYAHQVFELQLYVSEFTSDT